MHRGVGLIQVVSIIGRNQRQSHPIRQIDRHVHALLLNVEACVLDFHVVPVTEHFGIPRAQPLGFLVFSRQQQLRQFPGGTAGKQDQPFAVLLQDFFVDTGAVVKPFQERGGREFHQILKPNGIHGQQCQVITRFFDSTGSRFVESGTGSDIGFQSENRIDAGSAAFIVEFQRSVEIAVVGDGECVHPRPLHLFHNLIDPIGSIQQAVMRMAMQMCERRSRDNVSRINRRIRHEWHPFRKAAIGLNSSIASSLLTPGTGRGRGIVTLAKSDSQRTANDYRTDVRPKKSRVRLRISSPRQTCRTGLRMVHSVRLFCFCTPKLEVFGLKVL